MRTSSCQNYNKNIVTKDYHHIATGKLSVTRSPKLVSQEARESITLNLMKETVKQFQKPRIKHGDQQYFKMIPLKRRVLI